MDTGLAAVLAAAFAAGSSSRFMPGEHYVFNARQTPRPPQHERHQGKREVERRRRRMERQAQRAA